MIEIKHFSGYSKTAKVSRFYHFKNSIFGSIGVKISENVRKRTLIKIYFYIGIDVKWDVYYLNMTYPNV